MDSQAALTITAIGTGMLCTLVQVPLSLVKYVRQKLLVSLFFAMLTYG